MNAYAILCKALVKHYGLHVSDVRGHKETCSPVGRKTDPDFNMAAFRSRVASAPARLTVVTGEMELSEMDWTDKVALTATDAAVWNLHGKLTGKDALKKGDLVPVGDMIRYPTLARKLDMKMDAISAALKSQGAVIVDTNKDVEALAKSLGVDEE
jgi:hypothetical protein